LCVENTSDWRSICNCRSLGLSSVSWFHSFTRWLLRLHSSHPYSNPEERAWGAPFHKEKKKLPIFTKVFLLYFIGQNTIIKPPLLAIKCF
jgi:hypothetical protein